MTPAISCTSSNSMIMVSFPVEAWGQQRGSRHWVRFVRTAWWSRPHERAALFSSGPMVDVWRGRVRSPAAVVSRATAYATQHRDRFIAEALESLARPAIRLRGALSRPVRPAEDSRSIAHESAHGRVVGEKSEDSEIASELGFPAKKVRPSGFEPENLRIKSPRQESPLSPFSWDYLRLCLIAVHQVKLYPAISLALRVE